MAKRKKITKKQLILLSNITGNNLKSKKDVMKMIKELSNDEREKLLADFWYAQMVSNRE